MKTAADLNEGDLFIEASDTGYVWEFELFDDEKQEAIARRLTLN